MTIKTTEIDGNKIRYFEEGTSKNTLLLLHGLGASAERWENVKIGRASCRERV